MFSPSASRESLTPTVTPPGMPPLLPPSEQDRLTSASPNTPDSVARLNNDVISNDKPTSDLIVPQGCSQENRTKPQRRIRPTMISGVSAASVPASTLMDAEELRVEDNSNVDMVDDMQEVMCCETPPPQASPKNSDAVGISVAAKPPPRRVDFITLSSFKKTQPSPNPIQTLEQQ